MRSASCGFASSSSTATPGKRRVVYFGWRYDFSTEQLNKADDMPDFLRAIRARAGPTPARARHRVLGRRRHRVAPCVFRLRRKAGEGWERVNVTAEPRSVYLMSGPSRTEWEHSIPPVDSLRYSITFRNLR